MPIQVTDSYDPSPEAPRPIPVTGSDDPRYSQDVTILSPYVLRFGLGGTGNKILGLSISQMNIQAIGTISFLINGTQKLSVTAAAITGGTGIPFVSAGVRCTGSGTGVAGSTSLSNISAGVGAGTPAVVGNLPTSGGPSNAGQAGWQKIFVGTTAAWVPYWT